MNILNRIIAWIVAPLLILFPRKKVACTSQAENRYAIPPRRDLNRIVFVPMLQNIINDIIYKLERHALVVGIDVQPFEYTCKMEYSPEALIFFLFEMRRSFENQGYSYNDEFDKSTYMLKIRLQ